MTSSRSIRLPLLLATLSILGGPTAVVRAQPAGHQVYHGSVHDHTSEGGDDGAGTVQDALSAAVEHGFDFFTLTPHNHMVENGIYDRLLAQVAAAERPGSFIPLAGMEWGVISKGGHVGVLGAATLKTAGARDWSGFFESVYADEADPLVVLNHPKWSREFGGKPDADRVRVARLMEILGGPGHSEPDEHPTRCDFFHDEFLTVLNQGWRCGVAYGEDDHTGNWGRVTRTRMGIWAPELTRDSVMEALRARRTFVSEDPSMSIWIELDGTPMGGDAPSGARNLTVTVRHEDGNDLELALFLDEDGPGGNIAREVVRTTGSTLSHDLGETAPGAYVIALARDADGDLGWSSPIWIGASSTYLAPHQGDEGVEYVADLNFSSPSGLQRVRGIGKATARHIEEARRNGTLFLHVDDLRGIEGITEETFERIAPHLKVMTGPATLQYLRQLDLRSQSFVLVGDARQRLVMKSDRACRLLATQILSGFGSDPASGPTGTDLLEILQGDSGFFPATRTRILRNLRFMAREKGLESHLAELLPASVR